MTVNSFHGLLAGEETAYPAALSLILHREAEFSQRSSERPGVCCVCLPLRRDGARCSLDAGTPHTPHPEPASHLQHQITHTYTSEHLMNLKTPYS